MLDILLDSNILISAYPDPSKPPEPVAEAAPALLRVADKMLRKTHDRRTLGALEFSELLSPAVSPGLGTTH